MDETKASQSEQTPELPSRGDLVVPLVKRAAGGADLSEIVAGGLQILAVIVGLFSFAAPVAMLAAMARRTEQVPAFAIILAVAAITIGLSFAGVLLAVAVVLRACRRVEGLLGRIESHNRHLSDRLLDEAASRVSRRTPPQSSEAMSMRHGDRMVVLLEELAERSLLPDQQRRRRWEKLAARRLKAIGAESERLLREGRFTEAAALADELDVRLDRGEEAARLHRRVAKVRTETEQADLMDYRRRIEQFTKAGRMDRAQQLADELMLKYRDSAEVGGLRDQVTRQRRRQEAQQLNQLQTQIDQAIADRQWAKALATARQVLTRFGDSPAAQVVKEKIETLRANAEIEVRHEMEERIKGMIREHRYSQALLLARQVVEKYPDSPQAEALRGQLPRLQERAAQQQE